MRRMTQWTAVVLVAATWGCAMGASLVIEDEGPAFEISLAPGLKDGPVDGRLYLMISSLEEGEPRFQVANWGSNTQPLFAS